MSASSSTWQPRGHAICSSIIGTADVVNKRGGGPSPFLTETFGGDLRQAADLTHAHIEAVVSAGTVPQEERRRFYYGELAQYIQCPLRFKFFSIYGFAAPWFDRISFAANVRRALQALHQLAIGGTVPDSEQVREIEDRAWIPGRTVESEVDREVRAAAVEQISRYVDQGADSLRRMLSSEEHFSFPLGGRVEREMRSTGGGW
jgi:hypothetical protein